MKKVFNKSILIAAALFSCNGIAGLSLDTTRLNMYEKEKEIQYTAMNTSDDRAFLVNASISKSADKIKDKTSEFLISPPLFRIDPTSKNSVRIRLIDNKNLPKDRESIFYVTTSGIQATATPFKVEDNNRNNGGVKAGVAFKIKLFYRPNGIEPLSKESFNNSKVFIADKYVIIENKSPYYMDLKGLKLDGERIKLPTLVNNLVKPYSQEKFSIDNNKVRKEAILMITNDLGDVDEVKLKIN
ncbi:molecular chaperone [Providencia sneebia]|uniref:Fimbrial chaperone n=1 Tax=Providencia sneebia DSM 19967 TaxID=1141660 RepID=K8WK34_9GAMM|nr:molecular chaperone [Providencia sneebia]EKT60968.1 hypothetical protein OO7_02736 [Providencia sneebia DSM 19967]